MSSVTRKAHSRRQQRRAEIEQGLLEATEHLMGEGTAFTELSVDRLSTEAGISRATFYVYFEDKGQLLRSLARQVFAELAHGGRQWWDRIERHDPEDVRVSMASMIATYRRHQALITAVIEMAAYDPDVAETYHQQLDDIIASTAAVIEQGKTAGLIRPTLPTRQTAAGLVWLVERTVHQTARFTPPEQDTSLADALTEIIWGTLYLEPATPPT